MNAGNRGAAAGKGGISFVDALQKNIEEKRERGHVEHERSKGIACNYRKFFINLVTSEFAAPYFYKKCGFEVEFIRENRFNPKLTKIFFVKFFRNPTQTQGIVSS